MVTSAKVALTCGLLPLILIPALIILEPESESLIDDLAWWLVGASGPVGVIAVTIGLAEGGLAKGRSSKWALIFGGVISLAWLSFLLLGLVAMKEHGLL